jgi:hypothetical protein
MPVYYRGIFGDGIQGEGEHQVTSHRLGRGLDVQTPQEVKYVAISRTSVEWFAF